MSIIVEMKYNPFLPQLSILIDGRQPDEFSQLVQYTDEDIWIWCTGILDGIYAEVRNNFCLIFTGTDEDAQFMRWACSKHSHCLGFQHRPLTIHDSLQKRMGYLNQLIKRNKISRFRKTEIDAVFQVCSGRRHLIEDIGDIEISNLFCRVNISFSGDRISTSQNGAHPYRFVLVESVEEGMRCLDTASDDPAFLICFGENERFVGFRGKVFVYETTEEDMINTIFACFLAVPLLRVFRECIHSIPTAFREDRVYQKLSAVDPLIIVEVSGEIEAGKRVPIRVSLDPPVGDVPRLSFHVNDGTLVRCDGVSVFGQQPGYTVLEVCRYGEKKPFCICPIKVYARKRVTKIILAEDTLVLGIGDVLRLNWQYVPEDADNVDQAVWKSTDQQVVRVDETGCLYALGVGTCRVICSVENTSAICTCEVKPYLKQIHTNLEGDNILLEPGQEYALTVTLEPEKCVDGILEYTSSDYDVVNVVAGRLLAKNEGTAVVTVWNRTHRCSVRITVTVEKKRKPGFFRSLFRME